MKRHAKPHLNRTAIWIAAFGITSAGLSACGGGSDSSAPAAPEPAAAPTTLSGVVAVGSALAGASVSVIDADASTADPAAVVAGADGSYTVVVTGLKAPLLVRATGLVEGQSKTVSAIVPAVTGNVANPANVTSLTDAAAGLVAPGGDIAALTTPATLASAATPQKVADANALIVNTLKTDPQISAALGASFNPLTTSFSANGTGIDAVLDQLDIQSSASGVSILNRGAAIAGEGVPVAITLTAAQAATPSVTPTLPASAAAGDRPTAAELAAVGKKIEDCLALPVAQRYTADASGNSTAVSTTCNFVAADYRSNGRTWIQEAGESSLNSPATVGAKLVSAIAELNIAPANETNPKTFKHPYCNTANCTVARFTWKSASGQLFSNAWVLSKVNGNWANVGNQRPYDMSIGSRLVRYTAMNTAAAAANPTVFGVRNRVETQLRLLFSPTGGTDTGNVRAVRWTGPGLPATGVVLYRSQSCGTDDRFGITNQVGSTRVLGSTSPQFWTAGTGVDFRLSATNLDGSTLALPVPNNTTFANQDYSPSAVTATIPAWSTYTAELFYYSSATTTPDTPDEIVKVRSTAPIEPAAFAAARSWPTLAQAFQDAYLKPTGASAGAISSLATSMSWTAPADLFVSSSYVFSQNSATVTNSEGETASQRLRTRLDLRPAALGDLTGNGWQFATVGAGTALSSSTSSNGTNPNPRCTSTNVVPLTTAAADYREVGLNFSDSNSRLFTAVWYWAN